MSLIRIAVFCGLLASGAESLAGPVQSVPPPSAPASDLRPGEIQRLFDAMLVADAQDALALTDKQYPEFLKRLRELQSTRRTNQQERVRVMADLQRLSNPRVAEVDEAALKERLAALDEIESRTAAELRRAYTALDEVLDPRQRARFRLLEEQLERRKLELLIRARQNRQAPRRQD
jgi:hypothetical protein